MNVPRSIVLEDETIKELKNYLRHRQDDLFEDALDREEIVEEINVFVRRGIHEYWESYSHVKGE